MSPQFRPRVLFITPAYLPWLGGLEVLASQLLEELRARGCEVGLITCPHAGVEPGRAVESGVSILRTGAQSALARGDAAAVLRCSVEIGKFVRELNPDVVHTHDESTALWMYLRSERHKRPLIATLHNVMSAHRGDDLAAISALVREADLVAGVSAAVVADTRALVPQCGERLRLVRNAVREPPEAPIPIPEGAPLLCVGRLVPQKGFDMAVEAFARISEKHPAAKLQIAGCGPDRDSLMARARELGVGTRVELVGRVPSHRIPALLGGSLALVMPSRYEGLPLVALEAAWSARPVIAMAGPGLSEVVVDGTTGILVPPADIPALASAMDTVLDEPATAARLGLAARQSMERDWSITATVDAYLDLYRTALANRALVVPHAAFEDSKAGQP